MEGNDPVFLPLLGFEPEVLSSLHDHLVTPLVLPSTLFNAHAPQDGLMLTALTSISLVLLYVDKVRG